MSRLPSVGSDGNAWGDILNDFLSQAHNSDGSLKNLFVNVKDPAYGALCNGVQDDTAAIAAALSAANSAGGGIVFIPGMAGVSASLTVPSGVVLMGQGHSCGLQILAGFSGSQVLLLNGDFAEVRNMQIIGPTSTYSGNPAAAAIQITGARRCVVDTVTFYYVNGYMVQVSSTASINCYNARINNLYGFNCAQGIHLLGSSANAVPYGMSALIGNCAMDFTTGSGDCYLIEDSNDVLMTNIYGEYLGGTGNSIRIHGACNGVYVSNFDIGPNPGPIGNVVVIETGSHGSPAYVGFSNGIIEGGTIGLSMTAGQQVSLSNIEFYNNNTAGLNISGGFAYLVRDCFFSGNGSQAGSGRYDFVSSTAGNGEIRGCHFLSAQGSSAAQTNNAVNVTAGTVIMSDCTFYGSGYSSANIFNTKPSVIRNCPGYNPLAHSVTQPGVPATTVAVTNSSGVDCTVYVTGGTVTVIAVSGATTGLTSGAFRVPAGQPITLTYSVAPTWQWFGD